MARILTPRWGLLVQRGDMPTTSQIAFNRIQSSTIFSIHTQSFFLLFSASLGFRRALGSGDRRVFVLARGASRSGNGVRLQLGKV